MHAYRAPVRMFALLTLAVTLAIGTAAVLPGVAAAQGGGYSGYEGHDGNDHPNNGDNGNHGDGNNGHHGDGNSGKGNGNQTEVEGDQVSFDARTGSSGSLPFTGGEIALLATGAVVLLGAGFALRRVSRT